MTRRRQSSSLLTRMTRLIERAEIQGHNYMAQAIVETRTRLKQSVSKAQGEDDCLIKNALLPQHIQLLVSEIQPAYGFSAEGFDIALALTSPDECHLSGS